MIQELRYPRLSSVRWLFPYQWRNPCMLWQVLCLACKYLIFLPIYELAVMKQPQNLLHLHKTTRNTRKIANELMTTASGEINLQSKHDRIFQAAKVKAATSTHSRADVIPFFSVFIIPFESNASIKPKKYIYFTHNKENNIRKIVRVLMF